MTHTYQITGLTCAGCQYKVQNLLGQIPGVLQAEVNLEKGQASIQMDHHISTPALQQALKDYPKYQLTDAPAVAPAPSGSFEEADSRTWLQTYKPIVLIFAYLLTVSLIAGSSTAGFSAMLTMRVFMAGFFLVFSFFKLLNLEGFADSYQMYDVVAHKFRGWGYMYVFLELGLGLAYAVNFNPLITNAVALVVMLISIIGVLQTVLNKRTIRCACLGAVFNLPMSTVTIIEDGLMIAMSGIMLLQWL